MSEAAFDAFAGAIRKDWRVSADWSSMRVADGGAKDIVPVAFGLVEEEFVAACAIPSRLVEKNRA